MANALFEKWPSRRTATVYLLSIFMIILVCLIMRDRFIFAAALFGGTLGPRPVSGIQGPDLTTYNGMPKLQFREDGSFKISVLEDLHFGEGEDNPPEWGWGPISDQKSLSVTRTILDAEQPDFAVLNGDLITGENTHLENATSYLDMIVEPLVARDIPFSSTYGNHDQQFNLSSQRLLEHEVSQYPKKSYTRSMINSPEAGVSNYVLPIYSSTQSGESAAPSVLLWFFDSKGGSKFQEENPDGRTPDEKRVPIDDFVDTSVADWITQTNAELVQQYGRKIPSLAFVHIPIFAMSAFQTNGVDPQRQPGINDDNPLSPQSVKSKFYTAKDVPFMKALIDVGVSAVFSGHDHGDDWCFRWEGQLGDMTVSGNGMFVCFGRHTGYGGYGTWTRGSRQILLHEASLHDEIATWIRLENSAISGSIMLNSTYGSDVYPVAQS